ncbi:MAG TPA: acyl-CoA dehydrogenase family protein [Burkholderiaceae bacterium]|nr:acyl-CoA dehydrogenase family protein [Burkholderiaceae bacterium]
MSWQTHEILNQFDELTAYNLYATDAALVQGVQQSGAGAFATTLSSYGARIGSTENFLVAEQANRCVPTLRAFDSRGRRIDQIDYHPSWHTLLSQFREAGFVSMAFADPRPGRWVAASVGFYLHSQVEAGTMCPASMTQACIPLLQKEPALWSQLGEKLFANTYDTRDLPVDQKRSLWIGMGMTEKQGGSDVRSNTTTATPEGAGGRGAAYRLRGHKWFLSAPMCDAHLVVARSQDGYSCFYVPRWCPDGTKNAVHVQRLKDKLGNRSNASGEVEFLDAWGVLMGEEGHGIRTIIEMATYTRLSCVIASAAIMRQCLVQALSYTRQRRAFGRHLVDQPLMRGVLADLALESEAAVVLMLRLAQAFESPTAPQQRAWTRIMTPAAKFWVCKRAVELSGEAMEVFGGNGYVEESPMARLYREAPVNSIWEGSGNVMCLDVVKAMAQEPQAALSLLDELEGLGGAEPRIRAELVALRRDLALPADALEALGRSVVQRLVVVAQASLLRAQAPSAVAEGFLTSRLDGNWGHVVGAIDARRFNAAAVLERTFASSLTDACS